MMNTNNDLNNMQHAVSILREGGLVAFPTETVYGLGADAGNPDALRKIFFAKQRPIDHPLIVHISDISQLKDWAMDMTDTALLLAKTFWPGPLTLILKKAPGVSDLVTGNQETIGLRIPHHPVGLALLRAFGGGLAAPSANRFGRISPTTATAVREELGDAVDMILDGGPCDVGVESTIVDMSGDAPVILRPGMITAEQIEAVLKRSVARSKKNAPRVSGSLESHYAPRTTTKLVPSSDLQLFLQKINLEDLPLALLTRQKLEILSDQIHAVVMSSNPKQYAHDLYQTLRDLDKQAFRQIIIESVPETGDWDAIRDRLSRAASGVE